jgi:hypothetical protein
VKNAEKRKSVWTKPKEGYLLINVYASNDPDLILGVLERC